IRKYFPFASVFVLTEKRNRFDRVVQTILHLAGLPGVMTVMPEHVMSAIAFMVAHYPEHLTVDDVARRCGLSSDRLAHVFKDATGYAVREYGVLPISTAHRGDVRCGGRSHGRTPAEGRRPTRLQHGVQAGNSPTDCERRENGR